MHKCKLHSVVFIMAVLLILTAICSQAVYSTATIVINNNDGPGEGFNDQTAWTSVGGNPAKKLGQARLNAVQHAANIWAVHLNSSVVIEIDAEFNDYNDNPDLTCGVDWAILGWSFPITFHYGFANAPSGSWHVAALASSIAQADVNVDAADISIELNVRIGEPDCLPGKKWYLGLDGNPPENSFDLVTNVLHEITHGLGFVTYVDLETGEKEQGLDDVYMEHLEHHGEIPPDWPSMTDDERVESMFSDSMLHWIGPMVAAKAPLKLTYGIFGDNHVKMHAPDPFEPGSAVNHWHKSVSPNQLMEPDYSGPNHTPFLEFCLLNDIGWGIQGDLYMMDTPIDHGSEVNAWDGVMWITRDMWVNRSSGATTDPHQSPIYGRTNYVYVRVWNNSCLDAAGKLYVYWTKAATAMKWSEHWIDYTPDPPPEGCPSGVKYGDQLSNTPVDIFVPALSEEVYEIEWDDVPNPAGFECFGLERGHFCLLARIQTDDNSPYGMTYKEGPNVYKNTKNNNNIVWKNIEIIDAIPGGASSSSFLTRNICEFHAGVDLEIKVPEWVLEHAWIEFYFDLSGDPPQFPDSWGMYLQPTGEAILTDHIAKIWGIQMDPYEMRGNRMWIHVMNTWPFEKNSTFQIAVTQFTDSATTPDGGIVYEVAVHPPGGPTITLEKTHNTLQGHYEQVSITIENHELDMGGFDFLIAYDASALAFMEATPGQLLEDCGWEYFTYRYGVEGNCGDACPSGLLRIIALAETNNGPNHPSCYGPPDTDPHELAELKFFVTNDRTFDCQYVPIRFFWDDCNDNTISSVTGDTLFVSEHVYDFEGTEITDSTFGFPTYFGIQSGCLEGGGPDKPAPMPFITFKNGGIDIICSDSIDARGDINVNGVENEIADAVMFTSYFISGLSAFGDHVEASIAASDVNADGIALSVADLVYLVRIITGDAPPYPKAKPYNEEAKVNLMVNHSAAAVSSDSPTDIGAAYFAFEYSGFELGEPQLINGASDMSLKFSISDGVLKVLVYSFDKGVKIPAGVENIFAIPITGDGSLTLVESQISDYYGNLMTVRIEEAPILPTKHALHQNYPNPFNASTTILYDLPSAAHVRIEVFNLLGQRVAIIFDGPEVSGIHSVVWDGADESGTTVASGLYFYRITAGDFVAERKMMLIK